MDRAPLVTVIMNCLNCAKYVAEAVESVYAQSYPHWEIVFWDNASTDESGAIVRGNDSRLRYFRGEKTVALGRGAQLGAQTGPRRIDRLSGL